MTVAVIGTLAAVLSVSSFVPQAWKIVRTRKTDELSAPMWVMSFTGFVLWTIYGCLHGAWELIVPNAICAVLAGFILVMKLVSSRTKHAIADAVDPRSPGPH
ncbi:MAG TPA: SemiSWEET family transporter [Kofleriaceae bacterium]|nr:SemiSWEET family transporter [Kofleriaceae bacterium]